MQRALLPSLFLFAALPTLIFLALSVPTGEVPDEVAHIIRADSVRHGAIAGFRRPRRDDQGDPAIDVAVTADPSLLAAGFAFSPGTEFAQKRETRANLERLENLVWANRLEEISVPNTAVYPPIFYLGAALGMQGAKSLGFGPYAAILGGRLINVLCFSVMSAMALYFAGNGRAMLFAVLSLPMGWWLAASINQDGNVIACAALAGSLLLPGKEGKSGRRLWLSGCFLFGLAAMAKPFLLPLALIPLATVPGGFRRNVALTSGGLALAVLPALLWGGAMALFVAAPFIRGPALPAGPLWSGPAGTMFPTTNPAEQLHILLAVTSRLWRLPLDTAANDPWLWREIVGLLGTLDIALPDSLYDFWRPALAAAGLAGMMACREQARTPNVALWLPLAALAGGILSIWLVFILQYLSWTTVGLARIEGVQGRYFLPILVLAFPLLLTRPLKIPGGSWLQAALSLPAIALAMGGIASLSGVVLGAYYLR